MNNPENPIPEHPAENAENHEDLEQNQPLNPAGISYEKSSFLLKNFLIKKSTNSILATSRSSQCLK